MIVGSGLIAKTFAAHAGARERICFHAAGVSNSSCRDPREFERDRVRLRTSVENIGAGALFVYFSTCSVEDPAARDNPYTRHKREMEEFVRERDGTFITLRWVLVHMIEEYARHLGHADLLRERIDGATGY